MSSNHLRRIFNGALNSNMVEVAPKLFFLLISAIASQILLIGTASSGGVPDAVVSVGATVYDPSSRTLDQTSGVVDAFGGAASLGGGTANASLGPNITDPALVKATGNSGGTTNDGGGASVIYYMLMQGPNPAPWGVDVVLSTTITGSAGANAAFDMTAIVNNDGTSVHLDEKNGASFSGEVPLHLTPGTLYQIVIQAQATGYAPDGSASALADPHFFLDPSLDPTFTGNPSDYSIILSNNVGNGFPPGFGPIVTQVPAPSAPPLFATGLGALGLLGWRRKRKAQAV